MLVEKRRRRRQHLNMNEEKRFMCAPQNQVNTPKNEFFFTVNALLGWGIWGFFSGCINDQN
jgi:hypothetical protein